MQTLATYLSRFPALKRSAKFGYQALNFLLHFHRTRSVTRFQVKRITPGDGGFFGYFDKSPESPGGTHVLYHKFGVRNRPGDPLSLEVKNLATGAVTACGLTTAWNFQLGSRCQWIDDQHIVYNYYDRADKRYRAAIADIQGRLVRKLDDTVYDLSGNSYVTPDFTYLDRCGSEYGYPDPEPNAKPFSGIRIGTIGTAGMRTLVSLEQLTDLLPDAFSEGKNHHMNHLMFNPDGKRLVFILRWIGRQGRRDALFHVDLPAGNVKMLNTGMNSHYCWLSPDQLFGFFGVNGVKGYFRIDANTGTATQVDIPGLQRDGHPSVHRGVILIDSYPDASRMQHLMLVHEGKLLTIGHFFAPLVYQEKNRCDLHPRFGNTGDHIYFDSMHEGKRHLYELFIKPQDES